MNQTSAENLKTKKASESRVETTYLMMPHHANPAGNIYGGSILSMADAVAYMCAARHSGPGCVTVSVDQVDFRKPILIGEALTFKASVNYVGRTSMEVASALNLRISKQAKDSTPIPAISPWSALMKTTSRPPPPRFCAKPKKRKDDLPKAASAASTLKNFQRKENSSKYKIRPQTND